MNQLKRLGLTLGIVAVTVTIVPNVGLGAQSVTTNPYRPLYGWGELPDGREWGSTSAVEIAKLTRYRHGYIL